MTLFKNFVCDFEFADYILFVGGVSNTVRINNNLNSRIENITPSAIQKIKDGLIEEAKINHTSKIQILQIQISTNF